MPKRCMCMHMAVEVTDLQDEVAMAGIAQAEVVLVQVQTESGQVVILSADVCGQD